LQENLVDNASSCDLCNSCGLLSINIGIDEIVRSIGADIKDSHPVSSVCLIVIDRLVAVHILARGLVIVNRIWLILRPNCVHEVLLILKVSSTCSLTNTIKRISILWICIEKTTINCEVSINQESQWV
jgi:hypothetical protein